MGTKQGKQTEKDNTEPLPANNNLTNDQIEQLEGNSDAMNAAFLGPPAKITEWLYLGSYYDVKNKKLMQDLK